MNRSMVAGATLVAAIAIATPMLAWPADNPPPPAAAAPAQQGTPGMGGMQRMMGGMRGHEGMGPMGRHPGWMRKMMMHRMMRLSPQQRCEEHLARRAGMVAYVVAKLNLTAEQRPLWDKLSTMLQTARDKQRQLCAALKPAGKATILDRIDQREGFLSARLQALQQTRPALQQLYQALTPEQKAIVDHPFRP